MRLYEARAHSATKAYVYEARVRSAYDARTMRRKRSSRVCASGRTRTRTKRFMRAETRLSAQSLGASAHFVRKQLAGGLNRAAARVATFFRAFSIRRTRTKRQP